MHGNAARAAESEAGAERMNSATNIAPINSKHLGDYCPSSIDSPFCVPRRSLGEHI